MSSPFFISVILALPLTKLSSDPGPNGSGAWAKRHGLFLSRYEIPTPRAETQLEKVEAKLRAELNTFSGPLEALKELSARTTVSVRTGLSIRRLQSRHREIDEEGLGEPISYRELDA